MKKIEITLSKEETAKEFEEIVAVADRVLNSEGLLDFLHFSKVLDIPNMGRNKLFEWMRNKGILMEDNTPYQQHSDHFKVITNDWYGHISTQTFIKPQGIKYIVKKLIEDEKIPSLSYNEIMEKVETLKTLAS
jgi:anti-repressor protein